MAFERHFKDNFIFYPLRPGPQLLSASGWTYDVYLIIIGRDMAQLFFFMMLAVAFTCWQERDDARKRYVGKRQQGAERKGCRERKKGKGNEAMGSGKDERRAQAASGEQQQWLQGRGGK